MKIFDPPCAIIFVDDSICDTFTLSPGEFYNKCNFHKPPQPGLDIVLYCHGGTRSINAQLKLLSLGYSHTR